MKIRPFDPHVPTDEDADAFANCALGRRESADVLTQFVTNVSTPCVLAIDSPWGTGKTCFVNMWRQDLTNKGGQTLYFNAWESDFANDPFTAMVGELMESFGQRTDLGEKVEKFKNSAIHVAKRVIPIAAKIATLNALDLDKEQAEFASLGQLSEALASDLIKSYGEDKKAIDEFRDALQNLVSDCESSLVFFVDELDRCRPTFAIELLEKIKHLFSVQGVVFVLSVNREELSHSIQALYGANFDANNYLHRFIDIDYRLPKPEQGVFANFLIEELGIKSSLKRVAHQGSRYGISDLSDFYELFDMPLRQQIRLMSRIAITLHTVPTGAYAHQIELFLMALLKQQDGALYDRFISDPRIYGEVITFFRDAITEDHELWRLVARTFVYGSCSLRGVEPDSSHATLGDYSREDRLAMRNTIRRLALSQPFVTEE